MSESEDKKVGWDVFPPVTLLTCGYKGLTSSEAKIQATAERQQKKQKRRAAEGKLQVKRQEMDKAKVC